MFLDFELLIEKINSANMDILKAGDLAINFIQENKINILKIINNFGDKTTSKTNDSYRNDHPEWFESELDKKSETKEEVMARKSRDRIRGYYYKTKDFITKNRLYRENIQAKQIFDDILKSFNYFLIGVDSFSCLFDRNFKRKHNLVESDDVDTSITKKQKIQIKNHFMENNLFQEQCKSLCTYRGTFYCQGKWNENECKYQNHKINPYSSRENLILFQTWNLDHQMELSRTILPSLMKHVSKIPSICLMHNKPTVNVSVIKYFLRIFTLDNLKLVHIACHDKTAHISRKNHDENLVCEDCDEYKKILKLLNEIGA